MVRFHVINYQIINCSVSDRLGDILQKLIFKTCLYGIYQRNLLIHHEVRIITHTIWQRPKALEENLIAIVYSNGVYSFTNFLHDISKTAYYITLYHSTH